MPMVFLGVTCPRGYLIHNESLRGAEHLDFIFVGLGLALKKWRAPTEEQEVFYGKREQTDAGVSA